MSILPFTLSSPDEHHVFSFPFIFEGAPRGEIRCFLSGRAAGNMQPVLDGDRPNPQRQALLERLGCDPTRVYSCHQVHSREVFAFDRHSPDTRPAGDGLVSADPAVRLSVTVADCLPVYLYDTASGAFALAHSGWKGTGIVLDVLRKMQEHYGTRPEDTAAVLGPCIRSCCYRVDAERAALFEREFGGAGAALSFRPVVRREDQADEEGVLCYLDLQAANVRLLADLGVGNIAVCENCTYTDNRLGSFRREGASYTRMMALTGYGL